MECGHSGNFLSRGSEEFPGADHSCEENCLRIQPFIGLDLHSSAFEDVGHEHCG